MWPWQICLPSRGRFSSAWWKYLLRYCLKSKFNNRSKGIVHGTTWLDQNVIQVRVRRSCFPVLLLPLPIHVTQEELKLTEASAAFICKMTIILTMHPPRVVREVNEIMHQSAWYSTAAAAKSLQSCLTLGFSRQEHWSGLPFPPPMHESEKRKWSCSVVPDSSWPHGLQPTRLLSPWDFPGKSTGVGCPCLLLGTVHRILNVHYI